MRGEAGWGNWCQPRAPLSTESVGHLQRGKRCLPEAVVRSPSAGASIAGGISSRCETTEGQVKPAWLHLGIMFLVSTGCQPMLTDDWAAEGEQGSVSMLLAAAPFLWKIMVHAFVLAPFERLGGSVNLG